MLSPERRLANVYHGGVYVPFHITPTGNEHALNCQKAQHSSQLKTWIRGTHTFVSTKHLNRYLSEFAYRYNRRFKGHWETIFERLLSAGCFTESITYLQLVAKSN